MGLRGAPRGAARPRLRPAAHATRPVRQRAGPSIAAAALLATAALLASGAGGRRQLGALSVPPALPKLPELPKLPDLPVPKEKERPLGNAQEAGRIDLDPTGEIAKQVDWLNRNAGLQQRISFREVVEPLSRVELGSAMSILRDLEEKAGQIRSPNGFVIASATRQREMEEEEAAEIDLDPTGKIAQKVDWLNRNAGLQNEISFREVVAPLSRLDLSAAMKILGNLQTSAERGPVDNPNGYIRFAVRRAKEEAAKIDLDPTGKIAEQIGWLNHNAGLENKISFDEVVAPLSLLDLSAAMKILGELQNLAGQVPVRNPDGYIRVAARQARLRKQGAE